jgi:hypothetical protein
LVGLFQDEFRIEAPGSTCLELELELGGALPSAEIVQIRGSLRQLLSA